MSPVWPTSFLSDYESSLAVRTAAAAAALTTALERVPDFRSRFGRRHRLACVLALVIAAGLAGATRTTQVLAWAHDQADGIRIGLGFARRWPSPRTMNRILAQVDHARFDEIAHVWVEARDPRHVDDPGAAVRRNVGRAPVRGLAMDGKVLRGARRQVGARVVPDQMFAAAWQDTGVVAGQVAVIDEDEIGALPTLVKRLNAQGLLDETVCVTADAKHAQRAMVDAVRDAGAHFLVTVKGNQPTLRDAIAALDWAAVPGYFTTETGHGRVEERTVKTVTLGRHHHGLGWRDIVQVGQVHRRTLRKTTPTAAPAWTQETVYIMTSLPAEQGQTNEIAELVRGHWSIEVRREALCFRMGVRGPCRLVVAAAG